VRFGVFLAGRRLENEAEVVRETRVLTRKVKADLKRKEKEPAARAGAKSRPKTDAEAAEKSIATKIFFKETPSEGSELCHAPPFRISIFPPVSREIVASKSQSFRCT
jgi:hypothetical protein